ncbi:MAG TPA: LytTR family DNA-binding domain-containing protein [Bryobacteraceae bacterium]|nr:LytTR family DNA-binding domain-containing protein [Bryobacteraceae bacterium]
MTPPQPEPIRALVVDDETPARQRLIDLLRNDPQIGEILEAGNGMAAADMLRRERPDLVFLDVQMAELDGLGVIEAVGAEMPLTVFVTAYDQHAIRAFDLNALDYLLKPFSDERFEATMVRVKARLNERGLGQFGQRMLDMISRVGARDGWLDRFVVKSGGTTRFIRARDIDWIEAAGVYVSLHAGAAEIPYRATLLELVEKLDPVRFVRVHRSAIVNIESVQHLEAISHGEFEVVLKNGSRCRISRSYRSQLERRLRQPL